MKTSWTIFFLSLIVAGVAQHPHCRQFTMRDGLSQMKCTSMVRDSLGYFWIGTRNGLNRFDGQNFRVYKEEDGLLHNRIHQLAVRKNGELIIASAGGIQIYDGREFRDFPINLLKVTYLSVLNREDEFWLAEYHGDQIILLKNDSIHEFILPQKGIIPIYSSDDNEVLILNGSAGQRYAVFHSSNFQKPLYVDEEPKHLNFLAQDRPGNIVGNARDGFWVVGPKEIHKVSTEDLLKEYPAYKYLCRELCSLEPKLNPGDGPWQDYVEIASDIVRPQACIFDKDSSIWVASETGLWHLTNNAFRHFDQKETPYVWTVNENDAGEILMGSYGYGIKRFYDGQVSQVTEDFRFTGSHAASIKSSDGEVLFANFSGLMSTDHIYQIPYAPLHVIHDIKYDRLEDHYVLGGVGGIILTSDLRTYEYIDTSYGIHDNMYIQSVMIDSEGQYWLGSYSGLTRFSLKDTISVNYTTGNGKLPANSVFAIFQDELGDIWLGSDQGLMKYNSVSDSIKPIFSELMNEPVKSICRFDKDRLLIGAKDGLYLFNYKEYGVSGVVNVHIINEPTGFSGIEPGFNGFFRDSKNRIWITSATDLNIMYPEKYRFVDQSLKANIVSVNDRPISFTSLDSLIRFDGQEIIAVDVDAIGTTRPKQIKFSYQLDNENWSEWVDQSRLNFNNLDHGVHTLKIVAGPSDRMRNKLPSDQITFGVHIPFYQRSWFLPLVVGLCIFFFAWGLYNIMKARASDKLYRNQQLELRYFRNQLLLIEMNPHFVFNILASIQNKILTGRREDASNYLVKLADIIRNFLKASHQGNTLEEGYQIDHTLEKEVELIAQFVEFECDKSDHFFDYTIYVSPEINVQNFYLPPMIIQPFVENAIRHGLLLAKNKGTLRISFTSFDNKLKCEIEDNGVGREYARKVYEREPKTRRSLGLKIIKERIALLNQLGHQINLDIRDALPTGTLVTIIFDQEIEEIFN